MKIAVGSDHGGYALKAHLVERLAAKGLSVADLGCADGVTVDYPDYIGPVAQRVAEGKADQGIVICTTGIGASIVANKVPRVRAALCTSPQMATMARKHNRANVLALGGGITTPDEADAILDAWLAADFEGGRHARRVGKIMQLASRAADAMALGDADSEIYGVVRAEERRQAEHLELIASENFTSRAVREAVGSALTNKYAEGYPGRRWYNGCAVVDEAERLAIDRAKALFGAEHVNVQPHSGSGANMAVYFAVLEPGDTLMAMSLADGGHLTHGHKLNFSGRFFRIVPYGVDRRSEQLDYDAMARLADEHRPRMICAGASAYSRIIDFRRLREIADAVGAYLMVDMAHIAGLVAAGCHPSPVPHADFVTTTTHKTLRGPRGGMILCRESFAADLDRQVFPGLQGGPLMHTIAGKAVCFLEAQQPAFRAYQQQVVRNAQVLAEALRENGLRIVSGGTDNHMMLADLTAADVTGKEAAEALDEAGITVNKNAIPFDSRSPFITSGIRLGTPAVTTRGLGEDDMRTIAVLVGEGIDAIGQPRRLAAIRERVRALTARFPIP